MQTFTNQASLSYNDTIVNSNITVGQIMATLSMTKTALRDEYAAGDNQSVLQELRHDDTCTMIAQSTGMDIGGSKVVSECKHG